MDKNKYGLLCYESSYNLGDEVQSIAANQYLPRVDALLDRDTHNTYLVSDSKSNSRNIKIITNGWFDGIYSKFPFPDYIDPLFISFHINETDHSLDPKYSYLNKNRIEFRSLASHVDYLKKYEPIGCRDLHTVRMLQNNGIDAYFSGCLTLTLQNRFTTRNEEILVVDSHILCKQTYEKIVPADIRKKAIYLVQAISYKSNHNNKMKLAQTFLDRLAQAKLVITSRLHTLLPCLAFKTPVIFINDCVSDVRFTGLNKFFRIYTNQDSMIDIEKHCNPNANELLELIQQTRSTVEKWIHKIASTSKIIDTEYADRFFGKKFVKKGNSVITACMNRNHQLEKSLPSWLAANPDEIIIVDWNSNKSVKEIVSKYSSDKIKLITINNVDHWTLTRAFNLAARFTSYSRILKLDCDSIIDPDFFLYHHLTGKIFFAGDWRKSRDVNERHTNGIVYVKRKNFFAVGGYNELITTYGYDDCDLYNRLDKTQKRLTINLNTVQHLEHSNTDRTINQFIRINNRLDIEIEKNRLLAEMNLWDNFHSVFKLKKVNENEIIGQLQNSVKIGTNIDKILFEKAKKNRGYVDSARKKLYICTKNGLGNRLRALASAYVIAQETNRELVVIWLPDHHCQAKFTDLFCKNSLFTNIVIIESVEEHMVYLEINIETCIYEVEENSDKIVYNYEKHKNIYIDDTFDKDIYIVSACTLNNKHTNWTKECSVIKKLEPVPDIDKLVSNFNSENKLSDAIGVHVRMGQSQEKYSYENISNYSQNDKNSIEKWRASSHLNVFLKEIDSILKINPDQKFFICCDSAEAYDAIDNSEYVKNIFYFKRDCYDRSVEQIKSGLIDLLLLSKTKYIMGSNWSSFTEVAHRMCGGKLKLAGVDF